MFSAHCAVMGSTLNYITDISQVIDYIDQVISYLHVDEDMAEDIRSDALLDIAGRIKRFHEGKAPSVDVAPQYIRSNVKRLMNRHHDMRRRGVVGSALSVSGTRISAMKRYTQAVVAEQSRLQRELTWDERDRIGNQIRDNWHDPKHRPPKDFWHDSPTTEYFEETTFCPQAGRGRCGHDGRFFTDDDLDSITSYTPQHLWETLKNRLPLAPISDADYRLFQSLLARDPGFVARTALEMEERGWAELADVILAPFDLRAREVETLTDLLLMSPGYAPEILASAYECARTIAMPSTAHRDR